MWLSRFHTIGGYICTIQLKHHIEYYIGEIGTNQVSRKKPNINTQQMFSLRLVQDSNAYFLQVKDHDHCTNWK